MKLAYFDNAATTAVDKAVLQAMEPFFRLEYGNASSFHSLGTQAREAVEEARGKVAKVLAANPREIIFTSSATESVNLAHKGLIEGVAKLLEDHKKPHLITTQIEHPAVLESCKHLERMGVAWVSYLPVDECGLVKMADLEKEITSATVLVSVMYVNNEVGTVEPIRQIGEVIKTVNTQRKGLPKIYFHTDATQAVPFLKCGVDFLGVDLLSLTGHKFHAPKGVGALYVRKNTPLIRQQDGGEQEFDLRSSTENVPGVVGLGKAMQLLVSSQAKVSSRLSGWQKQIITTLTKIPGVKLTGHPTLRVPHICSFTVEGVEGEAMVLLLSEVKIAVSTGSACSSGSLDPSHVLAAMGVSPEISHGSLRISLSKDNTQAEVDYLLGVLPKVIERLRKMAPKLEPISTLSFRA